VTDGPRLKSVTAMFIGASFLSAFLVSVMSCGYSIAAVAGVGGDNAQLASIAVTDYKLPASIDPEVTSALKTELWARVYRPRELGSLRHPLLIFLHGDYATCGHDVVGVGEVDDNIEYTFDGKCPRGYFPIRSHEGYAYAANELAAQGYIVVSINANRGINFAPGVPGDEGLTLRRARLVLRHLQEWSLWGRSPGTAPRSLGFDPAGKIDFSQIGLMGHSRGGEGVRAAVTLFREAGSPWPARLDATAKIRSVLEIAPVDRASGRTFNATDIDWAVILPLCDCSVPMLPGLAVFDRAISALTEIEPRFKATFAVAGANHNFFNSTWRAELFQQPVNPTYPQGCVDQRPLFDSQATAFARQQEIAAIAIPAFFRATVGRDKQPELARLFNPGYPLPASLAHLTRIERSYSSSASPATVLPVEEFTLPTGQNSEGGTNFAQNIVINHDFVPEHEVRAGLISWDRSIEPGTESFFQTNWTLPGKGRRIDGYTTLTVRVSLQCGPSLFSCVDPSPLNDSGSATDFSIALVGADGKLSRPVHAREFARLLGPVGSLSGLSQTVERHPTLPVLRIPLERFGPLTGGLLRGVRFTFDRSLSGAIYLANIRLDRVR
jgi:hypothetical protein